MSLITTVYRVRNRMDVTTSDLTDTILEEFISDQQAPGDCVRRFNSRRGGRFTVKTRPRTQRFDLGEGGGAPQKGLTVWELIDAVVKRGDSIAKCTVQSHPGGARVGPRCPGPCPSVHREGAARPKAGNENRQDDAACVAT